MRKILLILTVFLSLTQLANAERWLGLIASVAALESAKVTPQFEPVVEPKPVVEPEPVEPEPVKYQKVCTSSGCTLIPIPAKATKTYAKRRRPRLSIRR